MPKLSIITITYNNAEGLKKTALSIEQQIHKNYQWIIIDGASTDKTPALLKTCQADIVVSEPDKGIYDAMNKGMSQATGDYILFLNAGDCFSDAHITQALVPFIESNPDFIYSDALEHDITEDRKNLKPSRSWEKIDRGMFTHHQAMIYARAIIKKYNLYYDTNYKIAADYKFTLQFLSHCNAENVTYIKDSPICLFECGGVSQTQSANGRNEQYKIRKEQKSCSSLFNIYVIASQMLIWHIAKLCPQLYNSIRGKKAI